MAKQRQSAKSIAKDTRSSKLAAVKKGTALKRQAARKSAAPARKAAASKKAAPTSKKSSSGKEARRPAASPGKRRAAAQTAQPPVAAPAPAPPAVRKPGFYEAVAIYERGVQALQRHDYNAAAGFFRTILDKYPEERELLERARLYLRVCERETARQPAVPKTAAERVYAATVALNSGDHTGALDHLQRALGEEPDSDHAHYIMAVALGMRGRPDEALEHLRRAIGLNPDNRGLAREDPDLESIRNHESFGSALNTPPASNRRRAPRRT